MLHELGPDGRGRESALELDVGVVVVADPDDAEEIGGVAGEPGVVAGSGFAGGGGGEAVAADGGGGAAGHDAFHEGLGEEGDAGIEDLFGLRGIVCDNIAVGTAYAGEHPGSDVDAAVGKDCVGAGHVDGRGAVGADRDGRGGPGGGDTGGTGEGGDVFVADFLGEGYGGDVERVGDGVCSGDHAGVLALFEVAGRVGLAVGAEVLWVVVDAGERGEDSAFVKRGSVERGVVGGGIDEGLEDGPGGAIRDGVIELRDSVVAASDEGEDLAGVRVERDEGDLRVRDVCFIALVLFADHLVDVLHADIDGLRRGALQVGVERGVDAETLVGEVLIADALGELIVDKIDEVGSFAGVDVGGCEAERLGFGSGGFSCGDGTGLDHGVEDDVAAGEGAFGMTIGIEAAGALDHASEEGCLGGVDLFEVFVEECLRRLAEAVDVVAAAVAQIDLVGVHLEDLLLGEAGLELEGDEDLDELALDAALGREEDAARELHGERGAAARPAPVAAEVVPGPAEHAVVVDAAVLEEAPVFY